jgi:two-component sensor histidine kinase
MGTPEVAVPSEKALQLAMVLHELGTNAVKYGALSRLEGTVHLSWDKPDDLSPSLLPLKWVERGGPRIRLRKARASVPE